jgi:hypothetical protein
MAAWPSQSLAGSLHVEPLVCVVGCPVREPRATLLVPCVWPSSHPNRKRKIGGTGVPVFAVCTSNRTAGAVSGSRRRGPRPADGAMANVRISRRPDQPTVRQPHPHGSFDRELESSVSLEAVLVRSVTRYYTRVWEFSERNTICIWFYLKFSLYITFYVTLLIFHLLLFHLPQQFSLYYLHILHYNYKISLSSFIHLLLLFFLQLLNICALCKEVLQCWLSFIGGCLLPP